MKSLSFAAAGIALFAQASAGAEVLNPYKDVCARYREAIKRITANEKHPSQLNENLSSRAEGRAVIALWALAAIDARAALAILPIQRPEAQYPALVRSNLKVDQIALKSDRACNPLFPHEPPELRDTKPPSAAGSLPPSLSPSDDDPISALARGTDRPRKGTTALPKIGRRL